MNIDCGRADLAPVTVYIRHTISVKTMVTLCLPFIHAEEWIETCNARSFFLMLYLFISFSKHSTHVDADIHIAYSFLSKHARNIICMDNEHPRETRPVYPHDVTTDSSSTT